MTGASRGIGRAIAIELGRTGCDVMINYVSNEVAAEEARAEVQAAARSEAKCRFARLTFPSLDDHSKLIDAHALSLGASIFWSTMPACVRQASRSAGSELRRVLIDLMAVNLRGHIF